MNENMTVNMADIKAKAKELAIELFEYLDIEDDEGGINCMEHIWQNYQKMTSVDHKKIFKQEIRDIALKRGEKKLLDFMTAVNTIVDALDFTGVKK